jgi:putative ABC transport system permease protein
VNPSWFWRQLLERALPAVDRRVVADELEHLYRLRADLIGRRAADGWYRREVLSFLTQVPAERFRSRLPNKDNLVRDWYTDFGREMRQAVRSLLSQPGITAVSLLALVLGVGANTLIFSVVDHVVLRPLPYAQPEELVEVWPNAFMLLGELDYFEEQVDGAAAMGGYRRVDGFNAELAGGSRRLTGNFISPGVLTTLGVRPQLGRNFTPDETEPGNTAVVLLSHGFWSTEFGGDDGVLGATLVLDGQPHEIVGVLPPRFAFPDRDQDVLRPFAMNAADPGTYWGSGGYRAIARLADGVSSQQLRDELVTLSADTRLLNPLWTPTEGYRAETTVLRLQDALVGGVQTNLMVMLGAVGLVLLVACANVANLLLARGLARGHDVAVRAALGASRVRLLRQQLTETATLVVVGSALALFVAWRALDVMVALLPAEIPRATEIRLDARVLWISTAVAMVAAMGASALPALRASRVPPGTALRTGSRGAGASAARRRLSSVMVVAQIGAAVVLVTGAGLLIRSLGQLGQVELGFDAAAVSSVRMTLTAQSYAGHDERLQFYEGVLEATAALPGVQAVAVTNHVPFGPGWGGMATFIEDVTPDPNSLPMLRYGQVSHDYFRTMGIPQIQGRGIRPTDGVDSELIAVVDQIMAEQYWPDESPLGKRIRYPWRGAPWSTVVGVVGSTADGSLADAMAPAFYVPLRQSTPFAVNLVMRSSGGAADLAAVREIVDGIDPGTPVSNAGPITDLIGGSLERARWSALLLSAFAGLTLVLGCIGVYGVVANSVNERTRDFGIQMALGAEPVRIRREVLRQGLMLALPGAAIGLAIAVPSSRWLESLLYGIQPTDPLTFAVVPAVLILATLVAVYVPARRATRVDPSTALRADT